MEKVYKLRLYLNNGHQRRDRLFYTGHNLPLGRLEVAHGEMHGRICAVESQSPRPSVAGMSHSKKEQVFV